MSDEEDTKENSYQSNYSHISPERRKRYQEEKKLDKDIISKGKTNEGGLSVSKPGMVIFVSKPGGGKSHGTRYIVRENRKLLKHGIAFSKSAFRPGNLEYVPDYEKTEKDRKEFNNFKWPMYNEGALRTFLNIQKSYPENERPLGFVIFDDDTSDPGMWKNSAIVDAATMFRQFNILLIINTQYVNLLPPVIRECATQVGLFKMDGKRSIEACYESYGQDFDNYDLFKKFLFESTKDSVKGIKEHKFIWKDKDTDAPWKIMKAPKVIPKFRIIYGQKEQQQKRGTKRKRKSAIGFSTRHKRSKFDNGFDQMLGHIRTKTQGDAGEDSITLPFPQITN